MEPLSGQKPSSNCTFRLDVTTPAAGKLKDAVKVKLAEFMGSYTDDVLAEYVVVLVGHGKRQAQAIADLEAFLGDQSEAFVTWLWDHLSANEASYVVQPSSRITEVVTEVKRKSSKVVESRTVPKEEQAVSQRGSQARAPTTVNDASQKVPVKSKKEPVVEAAQELSPGRPKSGSHPLHGDDQAFHDVHDRHDQNRASDAKRTRSPEPWSRRRRGFLEEKSQPKNDSSPPRVKASRRLLETAVRDAVGPVGLSISSGGALRRTERAESRLLESAMRDAVGAAAVASVTNGSGARRTDRMESRLLESAGRDLGVSTGVSISFPARRTESRLLDSAVRDAVAQAGVSVNSANLSYRTESGVKRLRSVVSADTDPAAPADANGCHHPLKSRLDIAKQGSKILPAMAVALKAAAAAAEDVNNSTMKGRGRSFGSVWDRLGNRMSERLGVKENEFQDVGVDAGNGELEERWEDSKYGVVEESQMGNRQKWRKISERSGKTPREDEDETVVACEQSPAGTGYLQGKRSTENKWNVGSMKDAEAFDDGDEIGDAANVQEEGLLINVGTRELHELGPGKSQESVSLQYRNAPNEKKATYGLQQNNILGSINPLNKVPNIHINANVRNQQSKDADPTLKAPHEALSQLTKHGGSVEKPVGPSPTAVDSHDVLEMKKRMRQVQLEMTKLRAKQAEVSKEVQKVGSGPGSAGMKARSQEEIDAHSVCVTNIHFAATKDIIVAHFGNCGDIVRVTVLTDNGKPKGSAYVEFSSKEGVEKALNLNDSSLLSRSLKVVRKDSTEVVAAPAATGRPSHFPAFVSVRAPSMGKFLRKTGLSVRRPSSIGRPFPGTAHLQWKRETAPSGGSNGSTNFSHSNGLSITPAGRIAALRSPNSLMGDRYSLGPIRLTRSMSYVRPTPYPPRQTLPAVQEQKVAN